MIKMYTVIYGNHKEWNGKPLDGPAGSVVVGLVPEDIPLPPRDSDVIWIERATLERLAGKKIDLGFTVEILAFYFPLAERSVANPKSVPTADDLQAADSTA